MCVFIVKYVEISMFLIHISYTDQFKNTLKRLKTMDLQYTYLYTYPLFLAVVCIIQVKKQRNRRICLLLCE